MRTSNWNRRTAKGTIGKGTLGDGLKEEGELNDWNALLVRLAQGRPAITFRRDDVGRLRMSYDKLVNMPILEPTPI